MVVQCVAALFVESLATGDLVITYLVSQREMVAITPLCCQRKTLNNKKGNSCKFKFCPKCHKKFARLDTHLRNSSCCRDIPSSVCLSSMSEQDPSVDSCTLSTQMLPEPGSLACLRQSSLPTSSADQCLRQSSLPTSSADQCLRQSSLPTSSADQCLRQSSLPTSSADQCLRQSSLPTSSADQCLRQSSLPTSSADQCLRQSSLPTSSADQCSETKASLTMLRWAIRSVTSGCGCGICAAQLAAAEQSFTKLRCLRRPP